jgi:hypothetical protein
MLAAEGHAPPVGGWVGAGWGTAGAAAALAGEGGGGGGETRVRERCGRAAAERRGAGRWAGGRGDTCGKQP